MPRPWTIPRGGLVAADCAAAVALAAFAFLRAPSAVWPLAAAAVVLSATVAVRRVWTVPVLAAGLVAAVAAVLVGVPGDAIMIAVCLLVYPAGLGLATRPAVLALGGALAAVALTGFLSTLVPGVPLVAAPPNEESFEATPVSTVGQSIVVIAATWLVARVLRARRADAEELVRLREQRAVGAERLRIARDVHDVVGHSLSLIAMKAAVAEHVAAARPEEGRAALTVIEQVSREALDDVRTVLGALREPGEARPDLDGVDRLVANAETAGLAVRVERDVPGPVPATVQASAYRIVQEALTNAVRYAAPRRCELSLVRRDGALVVTVANPTTRPPRPEVNGLLGVRERVAAHGGRLSAGGEPGGRFVVRATIPLGPAA